MKTHHKAGLSVGFVLALMPVLIIGMWPIGAGAQIATFKTLDKVTGKIALLEVEIGTPIILGSLTITIRACRSTPPEEPPETTTYVEIDETQDGRTERLFGGWMFASSPGLNGLEHAVYDLWPISCKTEAGELFTGRE